LLPTFPIVGQKRGMICYRSTNGIYALWKHLENNHKQLWNECYRQEKNGPKVERWATKQMFRPTPITIYVFFGLHCAMCSLQQKWSSSNIVWGGSTNLICFSWLRGFAFSCVWKKDYVAIVAAKLLWLLFPRMMA
jgi:hypothetical protein